ncbi:MAG: hypothetical protein JWM40_1171 [Frankiales bacterium]|nr:hypothetical protein [Frankiales bacterium]
MLRPVGVVRKEQVVLPVAPPPELEGPAHRSRALQQREAAGDREATRGLQREYDEQAPEWLAWTTTQPDYLAPLRDALDRGLQGHPVRRVLELAAGAGPATDVLLERFGAGVLAVDLSWEMLRRARSDVPRVQADAVALPLLDGSVDLVVIVNGVVHWDELWRVLADRGRVLLVSSYGPSTPLFTSLEEVVSAVPDADVVTSAAAHGEWIVVTRPGHTS